MLRNRIHRLLAAQHEVKLPQCSDLFGRKGLSFLEKLELPAPARLLLTQQLALLKELAVRIHEDEQTLEGLVQESPALNYVRSLPGWDQSWPPWSSARSTASSASPRLRSFVATPACVLPPTAAGAKRQTVTTLQQMAPLGFRRGRLGCHWLLGLAWPAPQRSVVLPSSALQTIQHTSPLDMPLARLSDRRISVIALGVNPPWACREAFRCSWPSGKVSS